MGFRPELSRIPGEKQARLTKRRTKSEELARFSAALCPLRFKNLTQIAFRR